MKNLDNIKNMDTLRAELFASMQTENQEEQEQAFMNFAEGLQNAIMEEAKETMNAYNQSVTDEKILISRGAMQALTSTEKKYFNAVIQRKRFEGVEEAFPKTIIAEVFKNLKQEHLLLSKIDK